MTDPTSTGDPRLDRSHGGRGVELASADTRASDGRNGWPRFTNQITLGTVLHLLGLLVAIGAIWARMEANLDTLKEAVADFKRSTELQFYRLETKIDMKQDKPIIVLPQAVPVPLSPPPSIDRPLTGATRR